MWGIGERDDLTSVDLLPLTGPKVLAHQGQQLVTAAALG
jgi:hypothetical protein